MKSVNVKLAVPQDLLDTVVYPNQKARRLAPLILQLLEGYRDNAYIRQYVDGEFTGIQSDIQQNLLNSLREAENQLNAINYLNEVSGARSASSMEYFQSVLSGHSTPVAPQPIQSVEGTSSDLSVVMLRLDAIEKIISALTDSMQGINLSTQPPAPAPAPASAPASAPAPVQTVQPSAPSTIPSQPAASVQPAVPESDFSPFEDTSDSSLDTSAADAFLASMF